MKLCHMSGSADAGEMAEGVLSRMEIRAACEAAAAGSSSEQGGSSFPPFNPAAPRRNHPEGRFSTRPDASMYQRTASCWGISAARGTEGAAGRAYSLLDRMEGQCRRRQTTLPASSDPDDGDANAPPNAATTDGPGPGAGAGRNGDDADDPFYNETVRPNGYVYNAVVSACAGTSLESDRPEALRLAFGTYNRMIDAGVHPTAETYAGLLLCCANLLPSTVTMTTTTTTAANGMSSNSIMADGNGPAVMTTAESAVADDPGRRRAHLTRTVFESACDQGRVNRRVLDALREADWEQFKAYRPLPTHSAVVGSDGADA